MKKHILDFIHRGVASCGLGPLVLAAIYLVLKQRGIVETLPVNEVCLGIFSLAALAFIAGGMNFLYQIERLPLMAAIFIHGAVLYFSYLATYLVNDWLDWGKLPVIAFTGIFVVGYLVIWAIIYGVIRRNTHKVNEMLKKKQRGEE